MRFAAAILAALLLTVPALAAPKAKKAEPKQNTPVCQYNVPFDIVAQKVKEMGYEHEIITDQTVVLKVATALFEGRPFTLPSKILIVFMGDIVRAGIVYGDKLCTVMEIRPADAFRRFLKDVHGVSVKDGEA